MGDIHHRLQGFFYNLAPHLIDADGHDDGNGKQDYDFLHTDDKGVSQSRDNIRIRENLLEILEPDPVCVQNALNRAAASKQVWILLESHYDSRHGNVAEYDDQNDRRNVKQEQITVLLHLLAKAGLDHNIRLLFLQSPASFHMPHWIPLKRTPSKSSDTRGLEGHSFASF